MQLTLLLHYDYAHSIRSTDKQSLILRLDNGLALPMGFFYV